MGNSLFPLICLCSEPTSKQEHNKIDMALLVICLSVLAIRHTSSCPWV